MTEDLESKDPNVGGGSDTVRKGWLVITKKPEVRNLVTKEGFGVGVSWVPGAIRTETKQRPYRERREGGTLPYQEPQQSLVGRATGVLIRIVPVEVKTRIL